MYGYLFFFVTILTFERSFHICISVARYRTEFLCIHKTWIGFPCLGFLRENFWYCCCRGCGLVVLFRCGWKRSDEYEWENNVSDSPTLLRSEERDAVTTLQGRGVKARDSHHFRVKLCEYMFYFPFSLIKRFSRRRRSLRMLWASNGWRGRLTSPPFHSVCRGASNRKHSFIPPCCRQVLWERTSMIKLKSYLNLWPEHYQGLQEERFNRGKERKGRCWPCYRFQK